MTKEKITQAFIILVLALQSYDITYDWVIWLVSCSVNPRTTLLWKSVQKSNLFQVIYLQLYLKFSLTQEYIKLFNMNKTIHQQQKSREPTNV